MPYELPFLNVLQLHKHLQSALEDGRSANSRIFRSQIFRRTSPGELTPETTSSSGTGLALVARFLATDE